MQKIGDNRTVHSFSESLLPNEIDSQFEGKLDFRGKNSDKIMSKLDQRLSNDLTYHSGKILGAMTQPGHGFARKIYSKYIGKNLGDPGLVRGAKDLEKETIQIIGSLLGDPHVSGNIVSGGTEANLIAMLLAKKIHGKNISNPEIVMPETAHYSFDKAATLMDLELKKARLKKGYQVDLEHYTSLINDNTIAVVGVAGTTALGLVDPLKEMGKIAKERNLFFHVDGAFGGLVLPFLKQLGHNLPDFGLSIPEINTYTVDPHKFGMGINPSGGILVRDDLLEDHGFIIPYLAGGGFKSFNILGTRPAASAISFWALLNKLGTRGFLKVTQRAWELTQYLKEQLESIEQIHIATEPETPVLGIKVNDSAKINCKKLNKKLRERGWALGYFAAYDLLRAVIMPHITREHIDEFIEDLHFIF